MIAGDLRVAVEESFADPENVKAAEEDDGEQEAEHDAKREDGILVLMDDGKDRAHVI